MGSTMSTSLCLPLSSSDYKQTPDLKDECRGYPGNRSGIESSKLGPLPGVSLTTDGTNSSHTGHIEQTEDHEGKSDERCPAKLGSDNTT